MKKIIFVILVLGFVSANAGLFSMVEGMSMPEIKPQAAYTINTAGINPRIYEFNTKVKPIKHCIVLFASSGKTSVPAMQCFDK